MLAVLATTAAVRCAFGFGMSDPATAAEPLAGPVAVGAAPLDIAGLLSAARGAPPVICALAARSLRDHGWGHGADAPASPLGHALPDDDGDSRRLTGTDVEHLLAALASDDACVRELSARLLGQREDASVVAPLLVSRLGAPSATLRAAAAFSLGLAGPAGVVDPLVHALGDGAPDVRANAAWALGRIGDGRSLAALLPHVRDGQAVVREAVVAAVGHFESTSTAGVLGRVLREDPAPNVRRVAAWALGQVGSESVAAPLTEALAHDADPRVREMAAWAVGQHDARGAAPALTAALRTDASDAVRETAAWALGESGAEGATDVLGTAAGGDRDARVRGTAAWALGQLDRHAAPAGLLRAVRDASDDVRLKAAWALGQIGDAGAQSALRDALGRETDARTRRALVRALLHSGGQSESSLTQLLASGDPQVREAAVRGLAGNTRPDPWPWPWPRPRPFP